MEKFDIPLLEAEDIECRVQSVSQSKTGRVGAVLLIYKDARVDMRIMDRIFGPYNWQRTHELIDGTLYCNIDIWDEDKKCWVRKQDAGVESNTEKEKGRASDAFKRAGFNIGIGRELYSAPFIWVELWNGEYYSAGKQNNKDVLRTSSGVNFSVQEIEYDDNRKIKKLVIVDKDGNIRYSHGSSQRPVNAPNNQNQNQGQNQNQNQNQNQGQTSGPQDRQSGGLTRCGKCNNIITETVARDGTTMTASEVAYYSIRRFGAAYCPDCQNEIIQNRIEQRRKQKAANVGQ